MTFSSGPVRFEGALEQACSASARPIAPIKARRGFERTRRLCRVFSFESVLAFGVLIVEQVSQTGIPVL
jgi:hypothetical protein